MSPLSVCAATAGTNCKPVVKRDIRTAAGLHLDLSQEDVTLALAVSRQPLADISSGVGQGLYGISQQMDSLVQQQLTGERDMYVETEVRDKNLQAGPSAPNEATRDIFVMYNHNGGDAVNFAE